MTGPQAVELHNKLPSPSRLGRRGRIPLSAAYTKCVRINLRLPPPNVLQIWCAVTMLTSIKNRVVLPRLLHLTGTVASCRRAAQQLNAARTARAKLTGQVGHGRLWDVLK